MLRGAVGGGDGALVGDADFVEEGEARAESCKVGVAAHCYADDGRRFL